MTVTLIRSASFVTDMNLGSMSPQTIVTLEEQQHQHATTGTSSTAPTQAHDYEETVVGAAPLYLFGPRKSSEQQQRSHPKQIQGISLFSEVLKEDEIDTFRSLIYDASTTTSSEQQQHQQEGQAPQDRRRRNHMEQVLAMPSCSDLLEDDGDLIWEPLSLSLSSSAPLSRRGGGGGGGSFPLTPKSQQQQGQEADDFVLLSFASSSTGFRLPEQPARRRLRSDTIGSFTAVSSSSDTESLVSSCCSAEYFFDPDELDYVTTTGGVA